MCRCLPILLAAVSIAWLGVGQINFAQSTVVDSWEGTMQFKSQSCPIELEIAQDNQTLRAYLSLPELGYFEEPRPVKQSSSDALEIELPFGLGSTRLNLSEQNLEGTGAIGDQQLHLNMQRKSKDSILAEPSHHKFSNDDLEFNGWLFSANRQQALGTILALQGSAQDGIESWSYRGWAGLLRRQGYNVFLYNKRPAERGRDLAKLASDARAALRYLRDIEPNQRLGIVGGSQAGWLAAWLAAEHPESVAFVAVTGWSAVTPREQELQRIAHELLNSGIPQEEIEEALAYANFYFYVAKHRELWPQLQDATQIAVQKKWSDYVETPRGPEDLDWWQANQSFPTWDHLARVKCPVFAAWGERDNMVPPSANAELLKRILGRGGNLDVTIRVYPEADHRIELSASDPGGQFRWPQFAPDFLKDLETWLSQQDFR